MHIKVKVNEIMCHSHRGEDIVGKGEPPMDEFLLFIVKSVAIVDVELPLCAPLLTKK